MFATFYKITSVVVPQHFYMRVIVSVKSSIYKLFGHTTTKYALGWIIARLGHNTELQARKIHLPLSKVHGVTRTFHQACIQGVLF